MKEGPDIAAIAALIGDPARAGMLGALMSGMALTAGELAREAHVSAQTASAHLAKLRDAGLILLEAQGRHRYFRLAGPEVAGALEGLMGLAARTGHMRSRPGPRDAAMRMARICYDHLAGMLGVRLLDAFLEQNLLVMGHDGLGLSVEGRRRFVAEGIDPAAFDARGRAACRACLDWSERRHHLAGPAGAAMLQLFIRRGWAKRDAASRAILFSPQGLQAFEAFLGSRTPGLATERRLAGG